jgi:hypothetical protein
MKSPSLDLSILALASQTAETSFWVRQGLANP